MMISLYMIKPCTNTVENSVFSFNYNVFSLKLTILIKNTTKTERLNLLLENHSAKKQEDCL